MENVEVNYLSKPPALECKHCGDKQELPLPMRHREVQKLKKAFHKVHRDCGKPNY
jgi:hypothetical protein